MQATIFCLFVAVFLAPHITRSAARLFAGLALVIACAVLLYGCGGGEGPDPEDDAPPATTQPITPLQCQVDRTCL